MTVREIARALDISVRSAWRYVRSLQAQGEPVYDEVGPDGKSKVFRLMASARRGTIKLTTGQMVTLSLCRQVFDFLDGTGFKEDLDDVFNVLGATLQSRNFVGVDNLDRKLFDVNEAPHVYDGRIDDINAIITALLREQKLRVKHAAVGRGRTAFVFDPYTLLVYQKGLYLVGHSHHHGELRRFALEKLRDIQWLRGQRFEYPDDYHPRQLVEGAFGLIDGELSDVRIFFAAEVAHLIKRRRWHPTQRLRRVKGGITLSMKVHASVEVEAWILSYGEFARVERPTWLRERLRERHAKAARA